MRSISRITLLLRNIERITQLLGSLKELLTNGGVRSILRITHLLITHQFRSDKYIKNYSPIEK